MKPRINKSAMWNYFERIDGVMSTCRICNKIIKWGGSTTNLKQHIRRIHPNKYVIENTNIDYTCDTDEQMPESNFSAVNEAEACISTTKNSKRTDYIEWNDFFMAVAFLSAKRSKDPVSQVGACIVNRENKIVGTGYNGMPIGCDDNVFPWSKGSPSKLNNKFLYVCHAELNAVLNKNSYDLKDCIIYVGLFPCNECAKVIIQSGIKEVIYMSDKHAHKVETIAAKKMFDAAGIKYRQYIPSMKQVIINFEDINWDMQKQLPSTPIKNSSNNNNN